MKGIQRLSLLTRDLRSKHDKLIDNFNSKIRDKNLELNNLNKSNKPEVKFNHSYDSDLSKTGLSNTLRGTNEVLSNQLRTNSKNSNQKIIKENIMVIPIKQILLEFTADHIRDNAGKYSAGTMLGAGLGLGYLATDPEHGANLFGGHDNEPTNNHSAAHPAAHDNRSDFQKDLSKNVSSTNTEYHNQNRGIVGNIAHGLGMGMDNLKQENKFQDIADKQNEYNEALNNEGNLLTAGQKLGIGATGIGALGLATKFKRR